MVYMGLQKGEPRGCCVSGGVAGARFAIGLVSNNLNNGDRRPRGNGNHGLRERATAGRGDNNHKPGSKDDHGQGRDVSDK